jgi:aerobic carbon-monoxide dehydrogenase small subunit
LQPLDGDDLGADGRRRLHEARAHERAVDEHRARAALALLTTGLGAGKAQSLPQHVEQALTEPRVGDCMLGAVDGALVCACLVLAAAAVGAEVVTVEGLQPDERGAMTSVQRAFVETGAVQCGFCTPGLVMAVHALLERDPAPGDLAVREAISGNLCRCTGYGRILEAVEVAIAARRDGAREAADGDGT